MRPGSDGGKKHGSSDPKHRLQDRSRLDPSQKRLKGKKTESQRGKVGKIKERMTNSNEGRRECDSEDKHEKAMSSRHDVGGTEARGKMCRTEVTSGGDRGAGSPDRRGKVIANGASACVVRDPPHELRKPTGIPGGQGRERIVESNPPALKTRDSSSTKNEGSDGVAGGNLKGRLMDKGRAVTSGKVRSQGKGKLKPSDDRRKTKVTDGSERQTRPPRSDIVSSNEGPGDEKAGESLDPDEKDGEVAEAAPCSSKSSGGSAIDDIFAGVKRRKQTMVSEEAER